MTIKQVREDLKEIRYYYAKQKQFESASRTVIQSAVVDKVNRYNQAIKDAPIQLYDLYVNLYTQNNTHEALAFDWDRSTNFITIQNSKLYEYLLKALA